ncbi:MAG: hypothetical protein RR835_05040, partial [Peptostreptococcaceae bacterium]
MKKLVVILCVLCSGLFFTNPILKSVFADNEPKQNKQVVNIPQKSQDNVKPEKTLNTNNATTDVKNVDIKDTTSTNLNGNENNQNDKNKNSDSIKDVSVEKNTSDNNINNENNTEVKENENINLEVVETPSPTNDTTTDENIIVKSLTKE